MKKTVAYLYSVFILTEIPNIDDKFLVFIAPIHIISCLKTLIIKNI